MHHFKTSSEIAAAHPGIGGAAIRLRAFKVWGWELSPEDAGAERRELAALYDRLRASEARAEEKADAMRRRATAIHKKALRAAGRREAARFGFVIDGRGIRTTGEG